VGAGASDAADGGRRRAGHRRLTPAFAFDHSTGRPPDSMSSAGPSVGSPPGKISS
jgi:hypothetical protein